MLPEPTAPGEGSQLPPGSPHPQTAVLVNSQPGSVSRLACQGREAVALEPVDMKSCGFHQNSHLQPAAVTVGSQLTVGSRGGSSGACPEDDGPFQCLKSRVRCDAPVLSFLINYPKNEPQYLTVGL